MNVNVFDNHMMYYDTLYLIIKLLLLMIFFFYYICIIFLIFSPIFSSPLSAPTLKTTVLFHSFLFRSPLHLRGPRTQLWTSSHKPRERRGSSCSTSPSAPPDPTSAVPSPVPSTPRPPGTSTGFHRPRGSFHSSPCKQAVAMRCPLCRHGGL